MWLICRECYTVNRLLWDYFALSFHDSSAGLNLLRLSLLHQCFDRELFRAFPSFYFLLWCDFDAISQARKPCLKSRKLANFALLQQLKLKSWSSKFFCEGSGSETVHFLPYNLASLWLPSCMVNPPQVWKVRKSAIKMCFYWCTIINH